MQVGSPEWIEASIAKLEQLEQERAEHEAAIETVKEPMALRRHTDALGRLDADIKSLYAQLEQYAEDDEDEGEEAAVVAAAAAPAARTMGDEELSAPHRAAAPIVVPPSAPLAAPIAHTPPAASPMSAAPMMAPMPTSEADDDLDRGGKGKWVVLGLLLVGGIGVGGFFFMQSQKKAADKPAATDSANAEVIKAAEIPDDTEAPKAAKGADVDRTPVDDPGADAAAKRAAERDEKKKAEKEKEKKKIKLGTTDEPLG